jgi:trk system potassium uptake protein TrkH
MRAEVPGPQKGKLVPKMRTNALILYSIYVALTVIMVAALLIAKMPIYDALVTAFGTAGTGGFSVLNDSIAGYNSPAVEWIVASFMVVFGINFNMYFFLFIRKLKPILKSEELRIFLILIVVSTALISVNVWTSVEYHCESVSECIRDAFFQVTSILSTSGYATTDYNLWPSFSKNLIILLTFFGACAGSTAGGLKISRLIIIFKTMRLRIKKVLKPREVISLKLDGDTLPLETGNSAMNYLAIYSVLLFVSIFLVTFDGKDFLTSFTATLTCINNVGPGMGDIVGPVGNFSSFSYFSKIILSIDMLFGRLEIIPMIIILSPSTWRGFSRKDIPFLKKT